MQDEHKTKEQLIAELHELRERVAELEKGKAEHKGAEESLREREERFSLAMEATKDGLWDWNLSTGEVYYSPGYVAMLGYSSSEGPTDISFWADRLHPEDRDAALKANMDCIENLRHDFEFEFRMQAKNMEWRWVLGRGKAVVRDENGRAVRMVGTHTDITERKRVEEALRASETKYRDIFENATEGIYRVTPEGSRFLTANPAAARILGYESPEELISTVTDIATQIYACPEDREEALRLMTEQGFLKDFDVRCRHKDGSIVWCSFSARIVRDEQGNILYREGTSQDITERKKMEQELLRAYDELEFRVRERTAELERANEALRAEIARRKQTEEALREAEKKYRSLFENAREGIYQSTPEGKYFTVNPAMARSYGYSSPEEMIGSIDSIDHQIFVIPEKRQELKLILEIEGEVNDFEVQQRRKDGSTFWASLNVHAVYAEEGSILYWEGRSVDITERKKAEEALMQSEERLRFLSSRLLEAQEAERKRIAGELHDSIGQSLAAIKFNVENVLDKTGKDLNGRIVNSIEQIVLLVQNSIEEVRRIYTGLRPSMLDDLGIIATIGWFCREFQNTYESICIEQQLGIEEAEIPEPLKIVIFRIAQEALNNVARHSGAELVNLFLESKGGRIEMAIEDNGLGFYFDSALLKGCHEKGLGIAGMKERAELSGGTFSIESVIGKGTTIHATWPSNPTLS